MSKRSLVRNFIMMMSMLLLLIAAAVAWFVSISKGNMDNAGFDSADAIQSAVNTSGGYYDGSDNLEGMTIYLIPSSGLGDSDASGKANLYTCVTEPFTEAEPLEGTWQQAPGKNEAYIDYQNRVAYLSYLDYYSIVEANHPALLALSGESKVTPVVADYDGTDPNDASRNANSKYGEFSVDNIAGAVRVAFILCVPDHDEDVTGELVFDNQGKLCNVISYDDNGEPDDTESIDFHEELVMIWVPNDTYELTEIFEDVTGSGTMVLSGAAFTANGTPEPAYYYYNGTEKAQYAEGSYCTDSMLHTSGYHLLSDSLWHNPVTGRYYANVKIRIWVEGYDREASIALEGGLFDTEIYLLTIQEAA